MQGEAPYDVFEQQPFMRHFQQQRRQRWRRTAEAHAQASTERHAGGAGAPVPPKVP